ncbi:hypothetical protein BpHYR1_052775 [Brachionus plicatilis]|uniref:Uncharacterized protein n=1 Tax=Brachionus plicatilis TaxID=10195 RepID=A0A3M7T0S8_BRAPC|nr:hypothetical protein BpHYR1_052775 [Brachionus plicatilis]
MASRSIDCLLMVLEKVKRTVPNRGTEWRRILRKSIPISFRFNHSIFPSIPKDGTDGIVMERNGNGIGMLFLRMRLHSVPLLGTERFTFARTTIIQIKQNNIKHRINKKEIKKGKKGKFTKIFVYSVLYLS